MKVVLKQDVKSIGKKDELHEVSDGYARNYLLPRGLAVAADAAAVNEVRTKAAASEHHAAEELANAQAPAKKLNGQIVAIKAKAGQGGRLFGSVTSKDIAAALTQKVGEPVDKRKIVLEGDIKNFGGKGISQGDGEADRQGGGISGRAAAGDFRNTERRARNARE